MKNLLKTLIVISFVISGLFAGTSALASFDSTSHKAGAIELQAAVKDRILIKDLYKAGNVLDSYFVTTIQKGYQYRGYLTPSHVATGGALYGGYLYRAPLPYPIY